MIRISSFLPRVTLASSRWAIVLATAFCLGCGETGPAPETVKQITSMRGLAISYGQFVSQNRGRPPKSEKALRKFVENQGDAFLNSFNLTTVDEIFTSPRDNEPYVVVYGKKAKIVAYEKTGVDGMRFVADDLAVVKEVDEAAFAELVPNAK